MNLIKNKGIEFLRQADIIVGGIRPWDIQVNDDRFFTRLFSQGLIAVGETYVEGFWECKAIDQFIAKALKADLDRKLMTPIAEKMRLMRSTFLNLQTRRRSSKDISFHYDLGNDLYESMLDKRMNYSCGYWEMAKNLDKAQEDKLELTCRKLKLEPGMTVLDIGCGFGGFAKYASERYRVEVTGISISKNQVEYAKERCKGLDVQILLQDYRDHQGRYDRIVSIGMIEHVGHKNYGLFMKKADKLLKEDGIFLLHTIGISESAKKNDPWLERYIFPGSMPPSVKQIAAASEGIFYVEDWHNFGKDYEKTLLQWHRNFNRNWKYLKANYDERFYRMWNFYLLCCAGTFAARRHHLWQIVFSKVKCDKEYRRTQGIGYVEQRADKAA